MENLIERAKVFFLAFGFLAAVVGIIAGVTYITPKICRVNEHNDDTPIQVQNYVEEFNGETLQHTFCTEDGVYKPCMKMMPTHRAESFEWRYEGTWNWAKHEGKPTGKNNSRPYHRFTHYDQQVCDSREQHAGVNGKIINHVVEEYFFI